MQYVFPQYLFSGALSRIGLAVAPVLALLLSGCGLPASSPAALLPLRTNAATEARAARLSPAQGHTADAPALSTNSVASAPTEAENDPTPRNVTPAQPAATDQPIPENSGGGADDDITTPATSVTQLRIIALTTPIRPGSEASLTAQTDAGVECQIGVYYRNGRSNAPELTRKTADASGLVMWRWQVEETAEIDREDSSVLVLCSVGRDLLSRGAPLTPAE